MKIQLAALVALALSAGAVRGQIGATGLATAANQQDLPYSIVARGAHHRLWQRVIVETNELGQVSAQTNSYTELETAMHRWANGQWVEASADIELTADGAAATNAAFQVFFAANVNTPPAIRLITPEGKTLRNRVFGLSYFDRATGKAVLLAETQDSIGQLFPPNRVVYTNAFDNQDGIEADVEYVISKAGFSQNIQLKSQLPSPAEFQLDPQSTTLQVLTEFYDPPMPGKSVEIEASGLVNEFLDFGEMKIAQNGRAFSVSEEGETGDSVRVFKQWTELEGRTFLVEEMSFNAVDAQIRALSQKPHGASVSPRLQGKGENVIAALKEVLPRRTAHQTTGKMRLAKLEGPLNPSASAQSSGATAPKRSEGGQLSAINSSKTLNSRKDFLIDYTLLTSQTNFTFACNTNYYVSGLVNLSSTTVIAGGTVIKFTNDTSAKISMAGPLICQTEAYRPAVLTSKDDNTVGETISGSTGSPSNINGGIYLYSSVSNPTNAIQYLRLSYAGTGLSFDGFTNGIWHCQFVKCNNAVDSYNQKEVRLYNVLMAVSSNCIVNSTNIRAQHLTVDVCSNLVSASSPSLAVSNSILTGVAATGVGSPTYDHVVSAASGAGIYQIVGGASYYLADGSTNRNAGTTSINAALLSDLKSRTTYPPLIVASNVTVDTVLAPQAQRDTDIPDLGYHYDPLDFVVYARTVSANLTLTNGVALGTYGASGWYGLGLNSGSLVSEGTPARLNWILRYNTVQEQSTTNWSASSVGAGAKMLASTPVVRTRFTGWSLLGGTGDHFNDSTFSTNPLSFFSHCRFGGGNFTINPSSTALTNCVWERVLLTLKSDDDGAQVYLFNNLFYGGTLSYRYRGTGPVMLAYDNVFDQTIISPGSQSELFTHDYNGYITNKNRLSPNGAHDVILTNRPVYATSYLGRYYYPTNDGMLSLLINTGSRYATNAALYHFTTTTNQVKEAGSVVDIGYHYVATDGNGNPIDTDGDGVPDYLEDTNGNGNGSDDATSWQVYNSPNGLVSGSGLQVFTPLK